MRVLAILTSLPLIGATAALAQNAPPSAQQGQSNGLLGIQQQLRNNLQQQGFSDIRIMPSSFLVRAKDRAGNPVMMVVSPDSVTAVTEVTKQPQAMQGAGQGTAGVPVPSGQNSGVGIAGQRGNKNGPAANPSTTGSANKHGNEAVREQDAAKIPGAPGGKSGPAVKPPSK